MRRTRMLAMIGGWIALVGGFIVLQTNPAAAIATDRFPDSDTVLGGNVNNVRASVALGGPGFSRNTPTGDFKIFYPLTGPSALPPGVVPLQLRVENACRPPDGFTPNTDMDLSMHLVQPDGSIDPANLSIKSANGADCVGNDIFMDFTSADLRTVPSMYGVDWGVIMLRAQKTVAPGATDFIVRVQNGNGVVTYAEQTYADAASPLQPAQSAFAMFDSITRDDPRDYSFDFKPDCSYLAANPGINPYIKWQDADANTFYENNNIWFTIERIDGATGNPVWGPIRIDPFSSPDIGNDGDFRSLQIQMGDSDDYFRWNWFDVTGYNGVEFWIPFSEMNRSITTCVPPPGALTCNVIVPAVVNPSASFNVTFEITNNTGGLVDAGDGYDLGANFGGSTPNYMAPNGGDWVRATIPWVSQGPIVDGGTMSWTESFQAYQPSLGVGGHTAAGPYSGTPLGVGVQNFSFGLVKSSAYTGVYCPASIVVQPGAGSISCSINISPTRPSVNQDVTFTVTINNAPTSGVSLTNAAYRLRVGADKGILGTTTVVYAPDPIAQGSSGQGQITANAGNVGAFTVIATVDIPFSAPITCPSQASTVVAKPYVKFFGNDVYAGGWFNDGGSTCAVAGGDASSTIKTYAVNDRLPQAYNGSSVEFAAFTMAGIIGDAAPNRSDDERGFYSASLRGNGTEGTYLTFSNNSNSYVPPTARWNASFWGDSFANAPKCIEDFYTSTRIGTPAATAPVLNMNTIATDGQYEFPAGSGTYVIQNPTAGLFARRATIYVPGDVFIDDNIAYDTNFAASIPYLSIIAKGNIYIGAGVTNIDALLIAQPNDTSGTTGGRIYTCAQRSGFSFSLYSQAALYAACNQKLTIHGALIAQQVRFFRTNGSLAQAGAPEFANSATAAEVIDTTPEFFMGTPMFRPRSGSSTGAQMYNAIQGLPPVF